MKINKILVQPFGTEKSREVNGLSTGAPTLLKKVVLAKLGMHSSVSSMNQPPSIFWHVLTHPSAGNA
jgi:hypothetical protein